MQTSASLRKLREAPHQVRQDRHIIQDLDLHLELNGKRFEVTNFSYFGLAICSEDGDPAAFGKVTQTGTLKLETQIVQQVQIQPVRKDTIEGRTIYAFKTEGCCIDVDRLFYLADAIRQTKELRILSSKYNCLSETLKYEVYDLRNRLEQYREKVMQLESSRVFGSLTHKDSFEDSVISAFGPEINDTIVQSNLRLQPLFEALSAENRSIAFDFFRDQLKHLIYESVFADRSYKKPRGYAGDFEMMAIIYRNDSPGRSLFSRAMEKAMQLHPEPAAVRNRIEYLKTKILQTVEVIPGEVHILSVACGPAMEVKEALKEISPEESGRIHFYLLDQDEEALKEADKGIRREAAVLGISELNLHLIHINLKTVITQGLPPLPGLHLIYSAGLFDYFTDPVAYKAGEVLWRAIHENGKLIIGNFDVNTPNQFGMLTLFDWHLILRSSSQMKQLYQFPNSRLSIESEKNGINIFSIIDRAV
jgi:extracellular factor (EF) 3-hydroxypalmitic acid methyl ester biosynthesis protein